MTPQLRRPDAKGGHTRPPASPGGLRADWLRRFDRLNELATAGDVAGAERVFAGLLRDASPEHGGRGDPRVLYNTTLKACMHGGELCRAAAWHRRMRECGIEPNQKTFGKLIKAAANSGSVADARRWLGAMAPEEDLVSKGDVVAYGAVLDACARARRWEEAGRLLQEAEAGGRRLDVMSYSCVASACARAGRAGDAAHWLGRTECKSKYNGFIICMS